ncbi:NACHT domain-containing protein [Tolypothrix campylonemoides VB511288]|nr:NACHT domain-containing protein [Tolypothrix campylonemoides VB511288]
MAGDHSANISGGNLQGFIQENNGIVNQNLIYHYAESYSRQTSGAQQPLTQVEYTQRKVLLSKVKDYWIKGVLEKSLHTKAMIELGLEKRSDAVERQFSGLEELPEESRQILPTETGVTEFFNQIGEGRTLLILGEPGAGKTTTLLKLAQNLIARAEVDLSRLIPVVFNLSSWGSKHQNIADWLVQELWSKYQVPKTLGKNWVKNQKLLLLLDGLDEIKTDLREVCVETINQFVQEHGQTEMVVCSRIADYEVLSNRLQLRSAIYIRSLTPEQVNQYLDMAGESLEAVKTLLSEDTTLQELAKSPLTLSIITLAYQGKKVEELPQTGSLEVRRQHLLNAYIERMFLRKSINQKYSKDQTIQWLTWLAQQMSQASQSVFLIEKIQPNWLQKDSHRLIYLIGVSLTVGLSAAVFHVGPLSSVFKGSQGLVEGLMGGVIAGLFYGLLGGVIISSLSEKVARLANGLTVGLLFGLVFWLVLGQKFGLTYGFFYALCSVIIHKIFSKDIEPADNLEWSWKKAMKNFGFALIFVLILSVTNQLIFGLIFGFLLWLILSWEKQTEIDRTTRPNQGIWNSVQTTIKISTVIGLFSGIVLWLIHDKFHVLPEAKVSSFVFGIANGIMFGYGAALLSSQGSGFVGFKHLILRLLLWRSGCIPWNYARFLDYANERIFLQKVGGGYIFIHRMLLEHFAQIYRNNTPNEIRSSNAEYGDNQPLTPVQNHIFCTTCGQKNPANSNFCSKCGTQLIK